MCVCVCVCAGKKQDLWYVVDLLTGEKQQTLTSSFAEMLCPSSSLLYLGRTGTCSKTHSHNVRSGSLGRHFLSMHPTCVIPASRINIYISHSPEMHTMLNFARTLHDLFFSWRFLGLCVLNILYVFIYILALEGISKDKRWIPQTMHTWTKMQEEHIWLRSTLKSVWPFTVDSSLTVPPHWLFPLRYTNQLEMFNWNLATGMGETPPQ